MNDRLMIAAMAMQGMLASPDCIGDAQAVSGDAIECADALLAAAGEGDITDKQMVGILDGQVRALKAEIEVHHPAVCAEYESKLAACERERDRSQSFAEGLQAELTEAIDARNAAEQSKERLAENLRKTRAAKFVCEQEAEAASIVIAALKRRLEPLTEDEASDFAWQWDMAASSAVRLAGRADRIRSRRQP
jgi:hypothetical protein